MKICKTCNKRYEAKYIFCPICHKILYLESPPKATSNEIQLMKESPYDDWNPPSPATIYCRIKNIPYEVFKYNRAKGLYSLGLRRVSD